MCATCFHTAVAAGVVGFTSIFTTPFSTGTLTADNLDDVGQVAGKEIQVFHEGGADALSDGGVQGTMPDAASGELSIAPAPEVSSGAQGEERTGSVDVEEGLPIDAETFSTAVMEILTDERGWEVSEGVRFVPTDSEDADVRVILASPELVDELCVPLPTGGYTSCRRENRAIINAQRWEEGAPAFTEAGGDLESYRQYVINHEVGHTFEYQHVPWHGPGEPAPIMVPQTLGTEGCTANPWPNP